MPVTQPTKLILVSLMNTTCNFKNTAYVTYSIFKDIHHQRQVLSPKTNGDKFVGQNCTGMYYSEGLKENNGRNSK